MQNYGESDYRNNKVYIRYIFFINVELFLLYQKTEIFVINIFMSSKIIYNFCMISKIMFCETRFEFIILFQCDQKYIFSTFQEYRVLFSTFQECFQLDTIL